MDKPVKTLSDMTLIHIISNERMFSSERVEEVKNEWTQRDIGELETNALIKMHDVLLTNLNSFIKEGKTKEDISAVLLNEPIDTDIVINSLNFNMKKKRSNIMPSVFLTLFGLYQTIRLGLDNGMGIVFGIITIVSIIMIFKNK